MAPFNKKKNNNKKGSKSQKKKGNKKGDIKDDVPASGAPDATTAADPPAAAEQQGFKLKEEDYVSAEEHAARREKLIKDIQIIVDGLARKKEWPDSALAAVHLPELHDLTEQYIALLRDEAKVLEGMEESGCDSYLDAVYVTSLAERALMDHADLSRRVRRYNYVCSPPKEGEEDEVRKHSDEVAAYLAEHRNTQAGLKDHLAAKLEAAQMHRDAAKRLVINFLALKKKLEEAQSKC
ncbi:hypothetical protein PG984_003864 [Apiospora sp. TS-2023a]